MYCADEEWTQKKLLVSANWRSSYENESIGFWQGFLWQNAIFTPILQYLKNEFIETLAHWPSLNMFKHSYMFTLMALALRNHSMFAAGELAEIMRKMDIEQLEEAAKCIEDIMTDSIDTDRDPNAFWRENVFPFLHEDWPKSEKFLTDAIVKSLSVSFITADKEFAKGFDGIWFIKRVKNFGSAYLKIQNSKAITTCTMQVLELLDRLIEKVGNGVEGYYLGKCLDAIKSKAPEIEQDSRFRRLQDLWMNAK